MKYYNIKTGKFISRPNRFIAIVEIDGREEICHVKNTGRCKELLLPGARVFLQEFDTEKRKTKYDLIAVYKGDCLINMDSQAPNKVFGEWAKESGYFKNLTLIKPEQKYGDSRFDFYIEDGDRKIFVEVKGVTLEKDGVALFPDAPTERGVKHINELCKAKKNGYEAIIAFVIQMKGIKVFKPNKETHPEFAAALKKAANSGVEILCLDCIVAENELKIDGIIPGEI